MRRWLYLTHRWAGIALCIVMAAWFLSGMVMMYVGYPKLTDVERWQGLPTLPADGTYVSMDAALQAAGLDGRAQETKAPMTWRLTSVAGRPMYVFTDGPKRTVAVDAASGRRVGGVDAAGALASARHFAHMAPARYLARMHEDAWTHSRALDAHRPLHIVEVDDAAGRWLYVSSRTGEVVRDATRVERTWGWIGAWLHWLYMFRGGAVDAWWTDIIITLSLAGALLALTGVVVGVMRWRFGEPYRSRRRTPYVRWVPRWHHLLGLAGGLFVLTWVVSGLLSVNPWKVFDTPGPKPDRVAYAGGPLVPGLAPEAARVLSLLHEQGLGAKALEWRRVGGAHYALALGAAAPRIVDPASVLHDGVPAQRWQAAAQALLPGTRIVESTLLTEYDRYYYAREPHTMTGHRERPLPAWRLRFDDADATAVTIDPHTASILQIQNGRRRLDRWFFAFLHSWDLPLLLNSRPLWDVWMVGFSLAGLGLSLTGVVTGWRRLRRRLAPQNAASLRPNDLNRRIPNRPERTTR